MTSDCGMPLRHSTLSPVWPCLRISRWGTLFGVSVIHTLREPLERLVGDRPQLRLSPLFQGLEPYPDGWRASVRKPDTLPHYPMDLHRGRCPDGRQLNFGRA